MNLNLLAATLGLAAQNTPVPQMAMPAPPPPPPAPSARGALTVPFETGQLRIVGGPAGPRACTGRGRGYEAAAAAVCPARATAPPTPGSAGPRTETGVVIGFTRAGERPDGAMRGPGRRLYDVEAEVELSAGGAIAACRIVRSDGPARVLFPSGDPCRELRRESPLFAPATGTGLRRGRLRISFYMDAPPETIAQILRPPPLRMAPSPRMPPITSAPPVYAPPAPPPPPPPPVGWGPRSRPEPRLRNSWFSSDDYPPAAMRAEQEGTVAVRLNVEATGRVSNCTIVSSSGSVALDAATCRIFRSRARFNPARDSEGRAIASVHGDRVRWVLPDIEAISLRPDHAVLAVSLSGDRWEDCGPIDDRATGSGLEDEGCGIVFPGRGPVAPAIAQGRSNIRITLEVGVPGEPRPAVSPQPGNVLFATTATFEVAASGALTDCRARITVAPRMAGAEPLDLCALLQRPHFQLFHADSAPPRPSPGRFTLAVIDGPPAAVPEEPDED